MWQVVLDHLLSVLVPLLLSVGLVLLRSFLAKKGLESSQAILDDVITRSVHYAEEEAHKALKKDEHLAGHEKMDAAMTFAESEMSRLGLDKMAQDSLTKMIESKLQSVRPAPSAPATPEADKTES